MHSKGSAAAALGTGSATLALSGGGGGGRSTELPRQMSSGRGPSPKAELIWRLDLRGVFRYKQQRYDYRQPGEGEEGGRGGAAGGHVFWELSLERSPAFSLPGGRGTGDCSAAREREALALEKRRERAPRQNHVDVSPKPPRPNPNQPNALPATLSPGQGDDAIRRGLCRAAPRTRISCPELPASLSKSRQRAAIARRLRLLYFISLTPRRAISFLVQAPLPQDAVTRERNDLLGGGTAPEGTRHELRPCKMDVQQCKQF